MGYDKFGLDWSVYGNRTPQRENSGNPMQDSIGRGWSQSSSNAAPIKDSDLQESSAPAQSVANNIRITSAKFIPDEETDFLKECKIRIEAQGDPATADVALWGTFYGTDYDLCL